MWSNSRSSVARSALFLLASLTVLAACAPGADPIGVCTVDPTQPGCTPGSGNTFPTASDAGSTDPVAVDAGNPVAVVDAGAPVVVVDAGSGTVAAVVDPTLLPAATTAQAPVTAAYDALGVPQLAAGASYLEPTSKVKIYKLTSSTFPAASATWNHDYAEGGDEVSLPYNGDGKTRAVLVRDAHAAYWLIDFTPGAGVSNPRQLTGHGIAPFMDLAFAFSSNPATPYYAYVSDGAAIRRVDIRTGAEAIGGGWPVTEVWATWLHQSENDGRFVWMRGGDGNTVVIYEPGTLTMKTYVDSNLNEPRMERSGRYVGMSMNTLNTVKVWDWNTNGLAWTMPGDPGIPGGHMASLKNCWMTVDSNGSFPGHFASILPATQNSQADLAGPANGTLAHGSGNWVQSPADPKDQWAMFDTYNYLRPQPENVAWLAAGGMVFVTANGERRLLGYEYNTVTTYALQGYAKPTSDGRYVLFTSDMDGSGRSDLFLAEMPVQ